MERQGPLFSPPCQGGGEFKGNRLAGFWVACCRIVHSHLRGRLHVFVSLYTQRLAERIAGRKIRALFRKARAAYNLSLIHISEPTRLGMISYAVFCLKKK